MAKRKAASRSGLPAPVPRVDQLLGGLRQMIETARARVATAANAELTLLNWRISQRIHADVLSGERTPYDEAILATLSQQFRRVRARLHRRGLDPDGELRRNVSR